jgi:hypothetical protein
MTQFTNAGRWVLAVSIASIMGVASATEGAGSVYPEGVETVMPGRLPGTGQTLVERARAWSRDFTCELRL